MMSEKGKEIWGHMILGEDGIPQGFHFLRKRFQIVLDRLEGEGIRLYVSVGRHVLGLCCRAAHRGVEDVWPFSLHGVFPSWVGGHSAQCAVPPQPYQYRRAGPSLIEARASECMAARDLVRLISCARASDLEPKAPAPWGAVLSTGGHVVARGAGE